MQKYTPHILERFTGCYDGIQVFLAEKDFPELKDEMLNLLGEDLS